MKRFIMLGVVFTTVLGSMYYTYASDNSDTDLNFINSYIESVASGEQGFLPSSTETFSDPYAEFNEGELKMLENERRAESIYRILDLHKEKTQNTKLAEPEILSYDMDKAIKAVLVGDHIFSNHKYDEIKNELNANEQYIWYIPAVNDLGENITLSVSKAGKNEELRPDAVYRTATGDDYIKLDLIDENFKENKQLNEIIYMNYNNSILSVISTDKNSYILPLTNSDQIGLNAGQVYDLADGLAIINDKI